MITMNEYYNITKQHYMDASMEMLDHFQENVIEVHHIGSTSIKEIQGFNDIDILIVLKTIDEVSGLTEILLAEGYERVGDYSGFFSDETIVRGKFGDFNVNFIFTPRGLNKKSQILVCKKLLNENKELQNDFQNLKQQFHDSGINKNQYERKKTEFFSMLLDSAADLENV